MWNSGIEKEIEPIHRQAIEFFAEKVIKQGEVEVNIGHCKIKMFRNMILEDDLCKVLWPETKDVEYQINVEVGLPVEDGIRWFVGIYYKMKDGKWVTDSEAKNSYFLTKGNKDGN